MPVYERGLDRFRALHAQVVGVSVDSRFANAAFAERLGGITYPLLSDFWPHGAVAARFGVFNEERGIANRSLFIVDRDGIVRFIDVHEIGEVPDEEQLFEELAKLEG